MGLDPAGAAGSTLEEQLRLVWGTSARSSRTRIEIEVIAAA
jgi:hypothetical protein